jgi:hypothetical protein
LSTPSHNLLAGFTAFCQQVDNNIGMGPDNFLLSTFKWVRVHLVHQPQHLHHTFRVQKVTHQCCCAILLP